MLAPNATHRRMRHEALPMACSLQAHPLSNAISLQPACLWARLTMLSWHTSVVDQQLKS